METRGHDDAVGDAEVELWANRIDEVVELSEGFNRVVRGGEEVEGELINTPGLLADCCLISICCCWCGSGICLGFGLGSCCLGENTSCRCH